MADAQTPDPLPLRGAPRENGDGPHGPAPDAPGMVGATEYGRHLLLVLRAALATGNRATGDLFSAEERALIAAFAALPVAAADGCARLVQRKRLPVPRAGLALDDAAVAAGVAAGWLHWPRADAVAPTAAALALVRLALLAATADPATELSFLARLHLGPSAPGRLALPRGCPSSAWMAAALSGHAPPFLVPDAQPVSGEAPHAPATPAFFTDAGSPTHPPNEAAMPAAPHAPATPAFFTDAKSAARPAGEAAGEALAAWDARAAGPSPERLAAALAALEAAAGRPQRLIGYHLDALHHWAHLAWDCHRTLSLGDPRRDAIVAALAQAPVGPGLAKHLAQETWRAAQRGSQRRALAGQYAEWSVFSAGERARWRLRATGGRARRRGTPWKVRHLAAWLDHAADGSVLAEGEGVEAHALRRLNAEGWTGLHAEGGFWLALTGLVFHDALAAAVPGAWVAPLQALPLDWKRWGFAARRRTLIQARLAEVQADPAAVLARAYAACAGCLLPGFMTPPEPAAAGAVCARLPRMTLVRLLERLIEAPGEAGGLPDLVVWRPDPAGALELWEVKSPGDQLSDRQRAWLGWFDAEGVAAGVLRLDPRECRQLSLFPVRGADAAARAARTRAVRPRRGTTVAPPAAPVLPPFAPAGSRGEILALGWADGSATRLTAHAAVPAGAVATTVAAPGWTLADPATRWVGDWRGGVGARQVKDWDRPVRALAAAAVYVECRIARAVTRRRWVAVPAGWAVAALVADQADPAGGVRPMLTVLRRRGGWLCDAAVDADEPVVVRPEDISALDGARDWLPHPASEPPRPEHQAWLAGYGRELEAQLHLVGNAPYALLPDADGGLTLALAAPCLWVANDARLRLGTLKWSS